MQGQRQLDGVVDDRVQIVSQPSVGPLLGKFGHGVDEHGRGDDDRERRPDSTLSTRLARIATANVVPMSLYTLLIGGALNSVLVPQLVRARAEHPDGGSARAFTV